MTTDKTSGLAGVRGKPSTSPEQTPTDAQAPLGTDAALSTAPGVPAGLPIAEVRAHVEAGDYQAASDRYALYLWDVAEFHKLMSYTAALPAKRDSWRVSAASAQATYTNWLVAVDKNLRGEVDALVSKWRNEEAAA